MGAARGRVARIIRARVSVVAVWSRLGEFAISPFPTGHHAITDVSVIARGACGQVLVAATLACIRIAGVDRAGFIVRTICATAIDAITAVMFIAD